MAKRINVVELKAAAHGRWLEILSALARDLRPALESKTIGKHVSCPVHKGKGQDGLRAYKNVGDTGGTVCNTCGNHPDGVQTLMWVNDWTFRKVLEEVDNYLGGLAYAVGVVHAPAIALKPERTEEEDRQVRESLRRMWSESVPLTQEFL